MVSAYKYDGEEIDEMLAQSEAAILHDEILGKAVDHEETIRVLSTRSSMQLSAIFNRYKDIYGTSITVFLHDNVLFAVLNETFDDQDLLNHPTNEYLSALRAAIRCIKNPTRYYAKVGCNNIV
jgi:annexin A13